MDHTVFTCMNRDYIHLNCLLFFYLFMCIAIALVDQCKPASLRLWKLSLVDCETGLIVGNIGICLTIVVSDNIFC